MHACAHCGRLPQPGDVRLLQDPRGGSDVAKLRRRAQTIGGAAGDLLRLLADRLEAEDNAVAGIESALPAAYAEAVEVLRVNAESATGRRNIARLIADPTGLEDLFEVSGILRARVKLRDDLKGLATSAADAMTAQGLKPKPVDLRQAQARALINPEDGAFWREKVTRPAAQIVREGFDRALDFEPLSKVLDVVARRLDSSVPRTVIEARGQVAIFDRFVTAETVKHADPSGDLMLWAYTGPDDGLERPFCDRLNGLYFTRSQVIQLDNAQAGAGHPMIACGGYGPCRHMWTHALADLLDALGFRRGADSDVTAANAAAAASR